MEENATSAAETKPEQPASVSPANPRAKLSLHRKLVFSYTVLGAIIGYISFMLNPLSSLAPIASLVLVIVVGIISIFLFKRILNVSAGGKRWWSTGILVYAFVWLIVWTILFNMFIVQP